MSWYTITYTCGHSGREQIYGSNVNGEREQEAARRGSRLCPTCYRQKTQDADEAAISGLELPGLSGSAKQTSWATDIRRRTLATLVNAGDQRAVALVQAREGDLTTARWWITHQHNTAQAVTALLPPTEEDITVATQAARVRTRRILDARPSETVTLEDPTFKPGRGQKRPPPILLNGPEINAMRLWRALIGERTTKSPPPELVRGDLRDIGYSETAADVMHRQLFPARVDHEVIRQWLSECDDQILVELVRMAVTDATTGDTVPWSQVHDAQWQFARRLQQRAAELCPDPPSVTAVDEDTQCRHGVSFKEDCDQCGL